MKQMETLRMRAVLENVPLAIDYVTQWAETAGFDDRALYEIQLAVDEACANAVHHAYQGMDPGEIEVSCLLDEQGLIIQVRDWGRGFVPENVEEPDVDAPLEERTLGGLGLFLVRQVMDDVEFTFDPEVGNRLRMTKRIQVAE
jgi:anti-sigma regulatory factor (Ser/Thr protein kinase)